MAAYCGNVAQRRCLHERDLSWKRSFYVALYPVNVVQCPGAWISSSSIQKQSFFAGQAQGFSIELHRPLDIRLGSEVHAPPPRH
jgi:hypothetical protein